jgi:serine/threonine protein kinase
LDTLSVWKRDVVVCVRGEQTLLRKGSFGEIYTLDVEYEHQGEQKIARKISVDKIRKDAAGLRELTILQRLQGTNGIPKLFDCSIVKGYLALDIQHGGRDLYQVIHNKLLSTGELFVYTDYDVNVWMFQLCDILLQSEKRGIHHCDLKPANIVLETETSKNLMIIDWGAGTIDREKSELNDYYFSITPSRYKCPEGFSQRTKQTPIGAQDVWSLGCIWVELKYRTVMLSPELKADPTYDNLNHMFDQITPHLAKDWKEESQKQLMRMLDFNPYTRCSLTIAHEFFKREIVYVNGISRPILKQSIIPL